MSRQEERLHALDAVRAGALLLGVLLHGVMSFFPDPVWLVVDTKRSVVAPLVFFVIHVFRMTIFFLIAGFFARMSFHRRGIHAFVVDRAKRIGLPLVVAWPLLAVSFIAVAIWAGAVPGSVASALPSLHWQDFPLFHTWFLYLLLWLYAATLLMRAGIARLDHGERVRRTADRVLGMLVKSHLAPWVLAAPLTAVFFWKEPWIPWAGIHTPDYGLVPNVQASVGFGTAFGFGWLLHRRVDLLRVWRRSWPVYLLVALGLTAFCLGVLEARQSGRAAPTEWMRLAAAAAYPLAIWSFTLAILGSALVFLSGHSPLRRYLADASYWIYLLHLPLVMALQVAVSSLELAWHVKLVVILTVTLAITLTTYHACVRFTFVGAVLNGRRAQRSRPEVAATAHPG